MVQPNETKERIGEYEVLRPLGQGGMGEVVLATKMTGLSKSCALKLLLPKHSSDTGFRRRFFREAEILAKFRHGSIVPVLDYGESDGRLFIAMEYIDGVTLGTLCRALAKDGRKLPAQVVGYIIAEVFKALKHAHHPIRGVIHRDVTPQNVMISSEGEVLLTDFGIARYEAEISREMLGTLQYIAPEQALGQACYRSDIYSACGVLHFMLTGRPPREATNLADLHALLYAPPPPTGCDDVPEVLERLRRAGLQPELDKRLASAREALRALEEARSSDGGTSTTLADIYEHYFGPPHTGMTGVLRAASKPAEDREAAAEPKEANTVRVSPGPAGADADGPDWRGLWWGNRAAGSADGEEESLGAEQEILDAQETTMRFVEKDVPQRVCRAPAGLMRAAPDPSLEKTIRLPPATTDKVGPPPEIVAERASEDGKSR